MAFKSGESKTLSFTAKPISVRKYLIMVIVASGYMVVFFYPIFLPNIFQPANLLIILFFCAVYSWVFWNARKIRRSRYLLLSNTVLKQVNNKMEFEYPMNEIQLVQINKNRNDKTVSLSLLMKSGKLWNISGYTDMDAIAKQVEKYVKTGRISGLLNSLRTRPWLSGILSNSLFLIVLILWRAFPRQVPFELIVVPIIFLIGWFNPTKTISYQYVRLLKHYLWLLGIMVTFSIVLIGFIYFLRK